MRAIGQKIFIHSLYRVISVKKWFGYIFIRLDARFLWQYRGVGDPSRLPHISKSSFLFFLLDIVREQSDRTLAVTIRKVLPVPLRAPSAQYLKREDCMWSPIAFGVNKKTPNCFRSVGVIFIMDIPFLFLRISLAFMLCTLNQVLEL